MKEQLFYTFLIFFACTIHCIAKNNTQLLDTTNNEEVHSYINVLDLNGHPANTQDYSISSFSDLGSWHSYGFSSKRVGFSGPFLMTQDNGIWLSPCFVNFHIKFKNKLLHTGNAKKKNNKYVPGKLEMNFEWNQPAPKRKGQKKKGKKKVPKKKVSKPLPLLQTQLSLIFVSERTALVKASFKNISKSKKSFNIAAKGKNWLEQSPMTNEEGQLSIKLPNKASFSHLQFEKTPNTEKLLVKEHIYQYQFGKDIVIEAGETYTVYYTQTVGFNEAENTNEKLITAKVLKLPKRYFSENKQRWQAYLAPYVENEALSLSEKYLAVKSVCTLLNNWRSPAGDLKHAGLFPSYAKNWFHGFWSWDSWKHAVALSRFHPSLAKEQVLAMFDYQNQYGMIADCIFRDQAIEKNNWRDTKPPLASWAVWEIYEQTKDLEFLFLMYPKLLKYHNWWYNNRDHNQNGLCEYGSTDGTAVAAGWESGMDNAVRFDDVKMLPFNSSAWSMNQESVDLNAYLFREKQFLAKMEQILGKKKRAKATLKSAKRLQKMIQKKMFDPETAYFYDIMESDGAFVKVAGPEGWIPLWAMVANKKQAEKVSILLQDETKFNTKVPFPTLAADHEKFNPEKGYWRGPVWIDQAYFALEGLNNYGYNEVAEKMKTKLLKNAKGVMDSKEPLRENYHPITGEGLNARHFSWTAAHLLLLLE